MSLGCLRNKRPHTERNRKLIHFAAPEAVEQLLRIPVPVKHLPDVNEIPGQREVACQLKIRRTDNIRRVAAGERLFQLLFTREHAVLVPAGVIPEHNAISAAQAIEAHDVRRKIIVRSADSESQQYLLRYLVLRQLLHHEHFPARCKAAVRESHRDTLFINNNRFRYLRSDNVRVYPVENDLRRIAGEKRLVVSEPHAPGSGNSNVS